ncbi:MAG: GxxExxY protein [Proteobacteria bacterium]|nr:GxxExxY protein [Pseudomonadota bacterium]
MRTPNDRHDRLTEQVICCAFTVHNTLGAGFLEKVYENALAHELRKAGLSVRQQQSVDVHYDTIIAGTYIADLVIEARLAVELKAVKALDNIHMAQALNYLRASDLPTCLLLNFGRPRMEIRRVSNGD